MVPTLRRGEPRQPRVTTLPLRLRSCHRLPPLAVPRASKLVGIARGFLINGMLDFSVKSEVEIAPQSVVYLGHVKLVNKERINKDDQASGGALPLVDQAVSGFSGGTMTVSLFDRYEQDVSLFKDSFLVLKGMDIVRSPIKKMVIQRAFNSNASPVTIAMESDKK